ncbi:hypothetical protein [Roseomonas sp. 18066]|uniref:hypothetical protein n=1 Tax=Roseomonas sp. 18066 TaxID=2681412 RepID=UPI0013574F53|nr:hypothetical protein [Roseomonas sp. 18066]
MHRRALLALLPLVTLAACGEGRPGPVGFGDSIRRPGLAAPWTFGDFSRFNGQPAAAARAVATLEHLSASFANDPFWTPEFSVTTAFQLGKGRDETRAALGIDPAALADVTVPALDAVAQALEMGDRPAALARLDAAPFRLGAAETLRRLGALPRLPEAERAAQMTAAELAQSSR